MTLALLLWCGGLLLQGVNIGFVLRQCGHPYRFRAWQWAWALQACAHSLIIWRRLRLLLIFLSQGRPGPILGEDLWEQLIPLGVSMLFLFSNWMLVALFKMRVLAQQDECS